MLLSWVGEEIETVALPRLSTTDQPPCLGDQEKKTNRFTLRSTLAYDFEQRLFRPLKELALVKNLDACGAIAFEDNPRDERSCQNGQVRWSRRDLCWN
jgi:hypothetical protein